MITKKMLIAGLALLVMGSSIAMCQEEATKVSLLKAWETIQKNDPQVLTFEKEGDNLYKFKTEHFPFEGKLKVLNVTVDDRMADTEYGQTLGVIEVELVDAAEDFMTKHVYSYSIWARNNTLYFSKEAGKWLDSKAFFAESQKKWKKKAWNPLNNLWLEWPFLLIFGILLFLFFSYHRMQRKNERFINNAHDLARETLETARDSNRVFKEILEQLKK